jgi:hypothetical protein
MKLPLQAGGGYLQQSDPDVEPERRQTEGHRGRVADEGERRAQLDAQRCGRLRTVCHWLIRHRRLYRYARAVTEYMWVSPQK